MRKAGKLWGFVVKLMALLALIGAFIAFMRMQEDVSLYDKLKTQGHVSRAIIESKNIEEIERRMPGTRRRTSGTTTTSEVQFLQFRFDKKSTVTFADFASGKAGEAALPPVPARTGDPVEDGKAFGISRVSRGTYDKAQVGATVVVANVPWNPDSPVLVEEINSFTPAGYYPWIGGLVFLAIVLWLLGRRIGKAG
ncbi:hypothetical protein P1X14_09150 [Sphingomonas sp. AOB5]|uniref:hypothetical protein n=1 Tax=Sphingomonas sp. AOB5 TaxID=3034017 RepID=UPI0023F8C835|nr:hypothetical protein [Sphingomonas sp. AOB5]MDF7775412.1 hypothetical protein [Sphingomonas sp. AOB5]